MTAHDWAAAFVALTCLPALSGCHSQPAEPPPPPASYDIVAAAPGARGGRAAGTDAAPPAPDEHELAAPDPGDQGGDEESDAGTPSDAGLSTDAAPGLAL